MGLYDKLNELKAQFLEEANAVIGGQDTLDERINVGNEVDGIAYDLSTEVYKIILDLRREEEKKDTEG